MILKFDVRGEKLTCDKDIVVIEGNKGTYEAEFEFDITWDSCAKVCVFENEGECVPVAVINNKAVLPLAEKMSAKIGVIGVEVTTDGTTAIRKSTNMLAVSVKNGAASSEVIKRLEKEPQIWEVHLAEMAKLLNAAEENAENAVERVENAANEKLKNINKYAEQAKKSADAAANSEAESGLSKDEADMSALEAKGYAKEAENAASVSQAYAEESQLARDDAESNANFSSQALSDLLSMINSGDIVLAQNGKLPLSSIPATATQEIYVVESEEELTSLAAQRGDLAELVEVVDGERTIIKTWQCLGDASMRKNWVLWGTSYAVQSGNAEHSNTSANATMINGHRLVEMSETEFENAVKDENTYYLVY